MTNLAKTPVYLEDVNDTKMEAAPHTARVADFTRKKAVSPAQVARVGKAKKTRTLSAEDQQIVVALSTVERDLAYLHNRYDQTTDPLLVDSIIYELKAAHMKYVYFLNLCKEKGIVKDFM